MRYKLICKDLDSVVWQDENQFTPLDESTHVWLVKTSTALQSLHLTDVLSAGEKKRMTTYRKEDDRLRFLFAHAYKRLLLSKYLNQSATGLQFKTVQNNKPELVQCNVHFNFSHSADTILFAFNANKTIGCDAEAIRNQFNYHDFMLRYYSVNETSEILKLENDDDRRLLFFKFWSRKEAWLKTTGLGVFDDLKSVDTALEQNSIYFNHEAFQTDCSDFFCVSFKTDPCYCSVTVNGYQNRFSFFRIN